ncbi:hypothetical protein GCM10009096_09480 [Parasphingorhabdus litoris]|uniref:Secreted protein n=1 Tax=Parasphingorhabdus litoris TaxID=394733 RepID=A0ABN1A942_9SPHN|nr:hypothetical protein [Parasphingorhabdus litoris]
MIKQALLFVVSTGVLIYFVTPVADDKQNQPTVQEASKPKPATQSTTPDYWGDEGDDDDTENEGEEFVFGQPVVYSEEEEEEEDYQPVPPASSIATNQRTSVRRAAASDSPKSGRLGSKENPIDLTPPGGRQKS